ncbi:thioredoxin domain-containing protein [Candidatus Saccharibacteria bacterium]|jgi:protein-disulfide isomerase|nr:thioredoxin domain-containing protein [Candidatus Saccharibacteria bacterium]
MDKRFWAVIGVLLIGFLGIVFINNGKEKVVSEPTNHVSGNVASKVTLEEYGDYQCPACAGFAPVTTEVRQKYKDTVKFQFRNLPLTQIHPNAYAAARAAEAADKQGKFWEMHDLLYTQSNWTAWTNATNPEPFFEQYAKQLNLNVPTFKTDAKSEAINNRIASDVAAFDATKQQKATPAFFLNGKYIKSSELVDAQGQPSVEMFSKILDAALAKK